MTRPTARLLLPVPLLLVACATDLAAQKPPYDVFPPAEAPYYRVRYEASDKPGELLYAVNYTVWIPPGVKTLRGVDRPPARVRRRVVQVGPHRRLRPALAGAGEEARLRAAVARPTSSRRRPTARCGATRATAPTPRSRSASPTSARSPGHPELAKVPWALWGHSGGGHWAGGMVMLHPDRVAAAWLRSGVPLLKDDPTRKGIKAHALPGRRAQGAGDVQPRHEGGRDRQGQELRRRVARERGVLQRGPRQGRAGRRRGRSAVEPRLRQPALPRHPVARRLPDRPPAEGRRRSAQGHAGGRRVARPAPRRRSGTGREVSRRTAQGRVAAERSGGESVDGVRQGHEGDATPRRRPRRRTCGCRATS